LANITNPPSAGSFYGITEVWRSGEINPLNVFGLRRVEFLPLHFTPVYFDIRTDEKRLTDWIYEHLTGRFFFDKRYYKNETGTHLGMCAAFEIPEEASFFALNLSSVNQFEII
jgi:hypothetical protein